MRPKDSDELFAWEEPDGSDTSSFELVLLCTGNRVRSPIAEGFLRELLADLPVRLRSLGTLDLGAAPPLPEAVDAATAIGLDISAHRARALDGEDLSDADLVLGFERRHLAAAVVDGDAPRERVFSLPELVELLENGWLPHLGDPVERARQAIARAHAHRGGRVPATLAELADPLGRDRDFYRTTVERVRDLSVRLAVNLFGEDAVRPLPTARRARRNALLSRRAALLVPRRRPQSRR